jgi:hypothetical protein
MDPRDVSLYDDSFMETSTPLSETTPSEKGKSKAARDPETNQTWDTVRKKKMIDRYENLLDGPGLAYRVNGVSS